MDEASRLNSEALRLSASVSELTKWIIKALGNASSTSLGLPGLTLYRSTAPTSPKACTYEPSLLVIPQGQKRIDLAKQSFVFGKNNFLLTSIELPVISRVAIASAKTPYLAFFLQLDMQIVRDLLHKEDVSVPAPPGGTSGMVLGDTTPELLTACSRMIEISSKPGDIPFFSKHLQREIIYRLLQGSQGDRLKSIVTMGDRSFRTARAINWVRENFERPLDVDDLATMAGMSRSTLHHHFRDVTAMSPLQFQKRLRLQAAREKMLKGELDAANAAFEVGYESPSQFNREYKRFFGNPPMRDIQAIRASAFIAEKRPGRN